MKPHFDAVKAKFAGKIVFQEIDGHNSPNLASSYGVKGYPTLVFLKNEREAKRIVGFAGPAQIEEAVKQAFGIS